MCRIFLLLPLLSILCYAESLENVYKMQGSNKKQQNMQKSARTYLSNL